MFTWKRNLTLRSISIGGRTISLSKTGKLLGVTLDRKLNCNAHIDNVAQTATAALVQCKRAVVSYMWGFSPKTCKWIYRSVVIPILSYSATVWVRVLENKNNLINLKEPRL